MKNNKKQTNKKEPCQPYNKKEFFKSLPAFSPLVSIIWVLIWKIQQSVFYRLVVLRRGTAWNTAECGPVLRPGPDRCLRQSAAAPSEVRKSKRLAPTYMCGVRCVVNTADPGNYCLFLLILSIFTPRPI